MTSVQTLARVTLRQPGTLVFGCGCIESAAVALAESHYRHALILCTDPVLEAHGSRIQRLVEATRDAVVVRDLMDEPTFAAFEAVLTQARRRPIDVVIGIGGGSVLDVAKLVSVLADKDLAVTDILGQNRAPGRNVGLWCLPTTAGTGSEVSPNAILLDGSDQSKKAVVSPSLVPDAAYIDPCLTLSVPPDMTSATGLDALTHCIEAYANRYAHPMVDLFALKGVDLISHHLEEAHNHGDDLAAREALARGSLYGGLCLGPVNTAAVHALAYPLGGRYHVPHGVSNALLLAAVMEFNVPAAPERYARIARALGCPPEADDFHTALAGVARVRQLVRSCGILAGLSQWGIPRKALGELAASAMTVERLLRNNPRPMTETDAEAIYQSVFDSI